MIGTTLATLGSQSPKDFNLDNPLQAEGAARGSEIGATTINHNKSTKVDENRKNLMKIEKSRKNSKELDESRKKSNELDENRKKSMKIERTRRNSKNLRRSQKSACQEFELINKINTLLYENIK
jgi:hypothetical protein